MPAKRCFETDLEQVAPVVSSLHVSVFVNDHAVKVVRVECGEQPGRQHDHRVADAHETSDRDLVGDAKRGRATLSADRRPESQLAFDVVWDRPAAPLDGLHLADGPHDAVAADPGVGYPHCAEGESEPRGHRRQRQGRGGRREYRSVQPRVRGRTVN